MIHHAKKSLGQNFLKSVPALSMMCTAGDVGESDTIIEIGPGKGALTSKLLEKAGHVIAIEKDEHLVAHLQEKFATDIKNKKLLLVPGDILEFDPKKFGLSDGSYKLIANIPYNITGAILKRFFSQVAYPNTMVLLVQKEVAERIVARDMKESILSLSIKVYGTPHYMMKVGKRFFSPTPKVDSAIIAIVNISRSNFKEKSDEGRFFQIIKAAFAHKRKVLRKNLEDVAPASVISTLFETLSLPKTSRAEDIAFHTWLLISEYLETI